MRRPFLLSLSVCAVAVTLGAQAPALDSATIARIRDEATVRSQVYEHVWWLSEVFGPRVTGTPAFAKASEWAMQKFRDWGLADVHQERWAFGQGWTIDGFSATMLTPQPAVLIGAPRNYSPSTPGVVTGDVVQVRIGSPGDFTKYAGTLRGKIVLMQPVRPVRMLEGPVILRMDEGNWWTEAATVPQVQPPVPPTPAERAEDETRQALAAATRAFLVQEGRGGAARARIRRRSCRRAAATSAGRPSGSTAAPSSRPAAAAAIRRCRRRCPRRPSPSSTTTGWRGCSSAARRCGCR